ncbi:hypothetical protein LAZ67_1003794 [Cordylochernes scorpioides]|uniref:Integrase zinc-binding domain-containing protein n=1 Tax=Cordylochernes scorpioides TaxID=51811 RepID=A0ABY6K1Z6_9ARAC|nr:hypothetical protein LAZ67_1003794 [Cordylochernes scorpioides]
MNISLYCDVSTAKPRPFVPASCRRIIFSAHHNLYHPGVRAITRMVTAHYVWPAVKKDIQGTVTGINYLTMLADSIFPAIRALYGNDDFYFQLDGAPPHYHRDVRAYLDQNLSGQWIGRRGPIEFPARSPDLTPLDFFLWSTVKDGVYKRKPRNLDILWNEIQAVCREISLDVLI